MHRRSFMKLAMAGAALGSPAFAQDLAMLPSGDLGLRTDLYARMARTGPLPPALKPSYMTLGENQVPVWVYVSPSAQRAKLVVFSHGALAEPQVYAPLLQFLTTHGYCVLAPIHRDSVIHDGLRIRENSLESWNFDPILNDRSLWEQRATDCLVAAYNFPTIANTINVAIDATHPIIIGHSFGAFTAQILLGVKVQTPEGEIQYSNDFWSGGVLLGPQGAGVLGLTETSWQGVNTPMMVFASGNENDLTQQSVQASMQPFYNSPEGYKHLVYIAEGDNTIYSGQRARPNTKEHYIFSDIKAAMHLFVAAYGGRNEEAFQGLYGDMFARQSYNYAALAAR